MNSNEHQIVVVGSPSYASLAAAVAKAGDWPHVAVEWGQYPDGGGYHRINNRSVQGKRVVIVGGTINSFERQSILSLATTLVPLRVDGLIISNPFMGTQRGDRWTDEGERPAAKLEMAQFSALPGVSNIELQLFDLHNESVADYGDMALRTVPCRFNKLTAKLVKDLAGPDGRVASADVGGSGRVKRLSKETGLIPVFAHKDRYSPTEVKVRIASDPELIRGRKIVLVDDIFETGGTAAAAARAYLEIGASSVEAFFSHAPTTVEAAKKILQLGCITHIHTTNSHPAAAEVAAALPKFVTRWSIEEILKDAVINPWEWLP